LRRPPRRRARADSRPRLEHRRAGVAPLAPRHRADDLAAAAAGR
jgi:hypothetical protein